MRSAMKSVAAAAALSLCALATVQAGAPVGATYVGVQSVEVRPDDVFAVANDTGTRLHVGHVFNNHWDWELGYADSSHRLDAGAGELRLKGFDTQLHRVFNRAGRFNPFVSGGIDYYGGNYTTIGKSRSALGLDLGGGLLAALGPADRAGAQLVGMIGLRTDVAEAPGQAGNDQIDPYASLGLRFNFGGRAAAPIAALAPVAAAPAPAPVDSDGDGVPDSADKCPGTVAGAKVDASGCELDSDRDGVVDRLDKCPETPAGATVNAEGCELDDDHDGVVNRLDKCPNTPAGDQVDAVGCGLTIALQVTFDTNSATIKPESYPELDRFVDFMKAVPSAKGDLEGHTDSRGADAYNKKLSQRRADSVKAYVVDKGVDAARINAIGYGESRPVADNRTEEGRAQNRRVQFVRTTLQQ